MAILLHGGNHLCADRIASLGPAIIPWQNIAGNSPFTMEPFHQVSGQEGLASWRVAGFSVNGGNNLTISGDWVYLQVLFNLAAVEAASEWSMFWTADDADTGTSYAVGVRETGGIITLGLWKRAGAVAAPPTYTNLAYGATTLSLSTIYRLNIGVSMITDSGHADYRRIKVWLDAAADSNPHDGGSATPEINHRDTACVASTQFSLIQQEITPGSAKTHTGITVSYAHGTYNDDGGSDDTLKGLLGVDWGTNGYVPYADVTSPNDYVLDHTGTAAGMTAGETGGNAWLEDTDESWGATEWVGATVTVGASSMVVTSQTGTNNRILNGTGAWTGGTPSSGQAWDVVSAPTSHKKYRGIDDKWEKNPGPASSPRTTSESGSIYGQAGGNEQMVAMADADFVTGSPQSIDAVDVFTDIDLSYTLYSEGNSAARSTSGSAHNDYMAAMPWGGAWTVAAFQALRVKFTYPTSCNWLLMEVAGHRLKAQAANDNAAADHADESPWSAAASLVIPRRANALLTM